MRNAFIDELIARAEKNEKIVLVVGDLGFGVIEPFAERFPKRFFNAGVAEQNMMGLSAGLASEGFHVFAYSIANFPTFRCSEQIRNDIDYHNLPVTVVAVGGGLAYGNLGYSHHAIQDYALLRSMPNMLIAAPGDPMEVRACMRYLFDNPQPSYLRLGKAGEPCIHSSVPVINPGEWLLIRGTKESKKTFLTTGAALAIANKCLNDDLLNAEWSLSSLPLWGMKYKSEQVSQMASLDEVRTVEDHLIDAGFGSWLLEACVKDPLVISRIKLFGLDPGICGLVGRQDTLNAMGGLTGETLCK
jgi:transketolase